jgi:hypothetical protein
VRLEAATRLMDNWAIWIAAAALALNFLDKIFGGVWGLSSKMGLMEKSLTKAIDDSKKEIEERQDTEIHAFGETVSALKEHVRQVEFHLRDNYIRKDDFVIHMKQHDDLLRLNFANITSRLERIEKHLDQKS